MEHAGRTVGEWVVKYGRDDRVDTTAKVGVTGKCLAAHSAQRAAFKCCHVNFYAEQAAGQSCWVDEESVI